MNARYVAEAALFFAFMALFRLLGLDSASALGGWIGRTVGPRLAASRKVLRNLALALPETSEAERRVLLRGVWDNVARTFAEYPHLPTLIRDYDSRVELVGAEHLRALAADPGLLVLPGAG